MADEVPQGTDVVRVAPGECQRLAEEPLAAEGNPAVPDAQDKYADSTHCYSRPFQVTR